MARLKPRSRFVIPLIVTVFGVSLYYANQFEQTTPLIPKNTLRKPDAFAQGAVLKEYNSFGERTLTIRTETAYYFKQEDVIETTSPLIDYINESGEQFVLNAKSGVYKTDSGLLHLEEHVLMSRQDPKNTLVTFETDALQIDTFNDFISTSDEVKITQNRNVLTSQGLKASLNDKKIELPQRVRGVYDLKQ